ncbi:aldo/keto reductase [Luteirhabdus pelagi]|uniref:aldo/keto reductase n=1 Tax=Luteirhabdus pelagi TaxID=2792783 RepID=UPI0019393C05|nr:aldo/keto reductase [Luteirhabdus pelagi]
MKTLKFDNKDSMHALGLGTWKAKGNDVKQAVKDALYAGYRHIDTAAVYGNEKEIGEALKEVFDEGEILREDVFVTSKLWNDAHQEGQVIPALQDSLKKLNLEYLDLYLMHWPVAFKQGVGFPEKTSDFVSLEEAPLTETWKQMEEAKKSGYARHIGVSNFSKEKLKDLVEKADSKPEMNQVEMHPYLQQKSLYDYCKSEGIHITGYSPLGSTDRSEEMKSGDEPSLTDIEEINTLAKKHSATPHQVLLAWHLNRGNAVIPKSTSKNHIKSNFIAAGIELDEDDMKTISNLNKNYRFITGKFFECPEKGYENIYDE